MAKKTKKKPTKAHKAKAKSKPKAKARVKVKAKAKPQAPVKGKGRGKAKLQVKAPLPSFKMRRARNVNVPILKSISRKSLDIKPVRTAEEKPLSNSEVQKYREILSQKQEELSEIVHRKKEEQEFQQEEPEIGDEADIATRSVEKELLFDITDSEKQNLDGIEAALRKIEKGVYGRCESCQRTIP